MNKILDYFMDNIKTKSIGFFVGVGAWVITLIGFIAYFFTPIDTYSVYAVLAFAGAVVLYIPCSLYKKTTVLGPIILEMGCFLALWAIAAAPMTEDYFSTTFFSGFTIGGLFDMDFGILMPLLSIIFGGIIAIVSFIMPHDKKAKAAANEAVTA